MIGMWLGGNLNVRLNHAKVLSLSKNLLLLKSHIPDGFARRPQPIENYKK